MVELGYRIYYLICLHLPGFIAVVDKRKGTETWYFLDQTRKFRDSHNFVGMAHIRLGVGGR